LERFLDNCVLWLGPHPGAGEECEEEGAVETMCGELTATPILQHPVPLGGGGREFGSEVEPRKKGGVRGRCF